MSKYMVWTVLLLCACQSAGERREGADGGGFDFGPSPDAVGRDGVAPDAGAADAAREAVRDAVADGAVDAAADAAADGRVVRRDGAAPPGDVGMPDARADAGPDSGPDSAADSSTDSAAPGPDAAVAVPSFLALGDSYTIGASVEPAERWPAQVVALLRTEGVALGDPRYIAQSGWTTFALDAALDEENPQGPFGLVSLLIGVNDQFFHETPEAYEPRFAALLARAVALAGDDPCRVIVLSIPDYSVTPFGQSIGPERISMEIAAFNRVNHAVATARGVRYVDVTPSSLRAAEDPTLIAEDGLHPSGRMYAEWAALVVPEARAALGCAAREVP